MVFFTVVLQRIEILGQIHDRHCNPVGSALHY